MIDYIDKRLRAWGHWSTLRQDGDHGHIHGFSYREPEFHAPRYCSTPLLDDQCMLTESAVGWLLRRDHRLGVVVRWHYRDGVMYTAEQCALFLGVSRRAYFYRLERAHLDILGYLTERAGGRVPQLAGLKAERAELVQVDC